MSSTEDGGGGVLGECISCWDQLWVFWVRFWGSSQGIPGLSRKPVQVLPGPGVIWSRHWNLLSVFSWGDGTLSGCFHLNVGIFTEFQDEVVGIVSDCSRFARGTSPDECGPGVGAFSQGSESRCGLVRLTLLGLPLAWRLETHPVYVAQCWGPFLGVQGLGLEVALVAHVQVLVAAWGFVGEPRPSHWPEGTRHC